MRNGAGRTFMSNRLMRIQKRSRAKDGRENGITPACAGNIYTKDGFAYEDQRITPACAGNTPR